MTDPSASIAAQTLRDRFGHAPECVAFAPGRVNLIGEHVDYVGGVVLPAPLSRGTRVALRTRSDRAVRIVSRAFPAPFSGSLDSDPREVGFAGYPLAAAAALRSSGVSVRGFDLAIESDLPIGAGLSSSASLLVATLRALATAHATQVAAVDVARLAREAETRFVGVACGMMDPMVCALGRQGRALRIDCRDGSTRDVLLPRSEIGFVVVDSGIRRELAHSAYNDRVRECATALAALRELRPDIVSLRDATANDLAAVAARLDDTSLARAEHVVFEIERVDAFIVALEAGDHASAGAILDAGHRSLRDRYRVSLPEVDSLRERLRASAGCLGARLTGAGFGGCLVAMVDRARADEFAREHGGFVAL